MSARDGAQPAPPKNSCVVLSNTPQKLCYSSAVQRRQQRAIKPHRGPRGGDVRMLGTSLVLCTQTEIVMRTSHKNNVACPHTHTRAHARTRATVHHNSLGSLACTTPVRRPPEPSFSLHVRCPIHHGHILLASTAPPLQQGMQCQQRPPG